MFESEQAPSLVEGGKKEQCRQQVTKECNTDVADNIRKWLMNEDMWIPGASGIVQFNWLLLSAIVLLHIVLPKPERQHK